jgi:hypothetical protein
VLDTAPNLPMDGLVSFDEFQAAALKSKDDGPTQAPGRPSILPETRIGSLFGLIYNSMD